MLIAGLEGAFILGRARRNGAPFITVGESLALMSSAVRRMLAFEPVPDPRVEGNAEATNGDSCGGRNMESLRGKTVRWTFGDGPVAGMLFEHALNEDGTVVWRALDGPWKGQSSQEQRYAAMKISDDVHAVSYLAKSGHTLTVVLNLSTGRAFAFASSNNDWHSMAGTFEVVQ